MQMNSKIKSGLLTYEEADRRCPGDAAPLEKLDYIWDRWQQVLDIRKLREQAGEPPLLDVADAPARQSAIARMERELHALADEFPDLNLI